MRSSKNARRLMVTMVVPWGRVATGGALVVAGALTLTIDPRIALAFLAVGVFLLLWATGRAAA